MTTIPPEVLADLLRAFATLRPEEATRREVARLLGVEIDPESEPAPPASPKPPPPPSPLLKPPDQSAVASSMAASQIERGAVPDAGSELSAVLVLDRSASRRPPDWLKHVPPLETEPTRQAISPEPEDRLLVPLWTRAILSGALSTLSASGPLDVAALVRRVARGAPLQQIPLRPAPIMAHGVQVLVDRGNAMLSFTADQDWLLDRLRSVVGEDRLQILSFEGCPSWGAGPGASWEWKEYFEAWSPLPGVTVMALTDLGIGTWGAGNQPVHPSEWRAFANRLRQAGCPLIALVPYRKDRWPQELTRCMKILHWDPATSARHVRRVLGRGLQVPGGPRV